MTEAKTAAQRRTAALKLGSAALACAGIIATATTASAGGFAVREQSVEFQGMSFAGSAAGGGGLSSMFWNPAALGDMTGLKSESHGSLFLGDTEVCVTATPVPAGQAACSGNIAGPAIIPASYMAYQASQNFWLGLGTNSPFGLVTKPDDVNYQGSPAGRKSKVFTTNFNPTAALRVMPGVVIGVGVQIQYMDATLKFATGSPLGASTFFEGHDVGFGVTAGIMLTPVEGTQIGIGYRSQVTHTLEGSFGTVGTAKLQAETELTTPDVITVSLRQSVMPGTRLLATFEWTNWRDFDRLDVVSNGPGTLLVPVPAVVSPPVGTAITSIAADWDDAWFASIGIEFDYSDALTLRGGIAYEESPVQNASQRLFAVPDANRFWTSVGATYKWNEFTSIDFAYTHVFVQDSTAVRPAPGLGGAIIAADVETDVNIVSASLKTDLGHTLSLLLGALQ